MGVRKFRSVEELPGPPRRKALDPENLRIAFGLMSVGDGFHPVVRPPGVIRFRSWEELVAWREETARRQRRAGRSVDEKSESTKLKTEPVWT